MLLNYEIYEAGTTILYKCHNTHLYNYIYICFCALMKITFYNTIYEIGVWGKVGGKYKYIYVFIYGEYVYI